MDNKARDARRQMINDLTPWQDKVKAWFVKWTMITIIVVLVIAYLSNVK